ncbi:MAG: hypothetical protein ACPG8V_02960 [Alphaproteobacteria bacterium]
MNNNLAWAGDNKPYELEEVEKALFKIFSSDEGKILWSYLKHTVIENYSQEMDTNKIHMHNGKRILVMHLKQLAQRQVG